MDDGSAHRFRLNLNDSFYQPNSLAPHARETETSALLAVSKSKPSPKSLRDHCYFLLRSSSL